MKITPRQLNSFLLLKLPSAWICGVRVKSIDRNSCVVTVKHRWMNQNPFKSMFWAVQGMAAELTTGALVTGYIRNSGKNISMLVANNNATFTKKATGRITFKCNDGELVKKAIEKTIETGEGQTVWMKSIGTNAEGIEVSTFNFEWTLKVKN
ncbi:DUF4442 domain-containing protein [Aquimarina sp. AU474]|uniref:DUF4442 domain-containing protein n=1 Tax=Aquimarina sp. AU474 TaxID=2108529 RepID=UPI000D68F099|nr:DUF4442 domain-containing protein [Aquimarina sp. AU474]